MITINSTERLILNAIVFFVRDGKGVQEAITCRLFLFECYTINIRCKTFSGSNIS